MEIWRREAGETTNSISAKFAVAFAALVLIGAAPGPPDLSFLSLGGPRPPRLSDEDQTLYRAAFEAAEQEDWEHALAQSSQADNQILTSVLLWMRYLEADGGGTFAEISAFISTHPDWPLQVTLAVRAEARIDPAMDPARVLEWFQHHPPTSGVGMLRLAQAHLSMGQSEDAEAWAVQAWTSTRMEPGSEAALLDTFALALTPRHHEVRLDQLIWRGMADAARRVLPLVNENTAAVGRARIALMLRLGGVDAAIGAVPEDLLTEPGLVFERVRWRRAPAIPKTPSPCWCRRPQSWVGPGRGGPSATFWRGGPWIWATSQTPINSPGIMANPAALILPPQNGWLGGSP